MFDCATNWVVARHSEFTIFDLFSGLSFQYFSLKHLIGWEINLLFSISSPKTIKILLSNSHEFVDSVIVSILKNPSITILLIGF